MALKIFASNNQETTYHCACIELHRAVCAKRHKAVENLEDSVAKTVGMRKCGGFICEKAV